MAQDNVQKRPNICSSKPLTYKKWDDLEFSSDEDDCHPNIEIGTWRRMKERMRKEKGIKKREPDLRDKWNVTSTNKKYHIDPAKPPKKTSDQPQLQKDKDNDNKNDNDNDNDKPATVPSNTVSDPPAQPKPQTVPQPQPQPQPQSQPAPQPPPQTAPAVKANKKKKDKVISLGYDNDNPSLNAPKDDNDLYAARSNPQTFLDKNLDKLRKFASIKRDSKADKFIRRNPNIVHEASEGYLITFAVDRAVEGALKPELRRLSRRCLMIHNLVQSCSQQNVSPEKGVAKFYQKIGKDTKITESYNIELNKQVIELMERIEQRRIERLAELQDIPDQYDEDDKAPVGPGGLDPTEVLNSLPKEMQDAFVQQDIEKLKQYLVTLPKSEAEYHMQRCIDSGLWVQPDDDIDDNDVVVVDKNVTIAVDNDKNVDKNIDNIADDNNK